VATSCGLPFYFSVKGIIFVSVSFALIS